MFIPLVTLVTACYVPSGLETAAKLLCEVFPCARTIADAPAPPWWIFILLFVYAGGCVGYIGMLESRPQT